MNEMVVLIIEDDIHIKRLISTTLIASGYKVLLAKDGKEAILEATMHNPDIILLDLGLPDMDGIEIIEKIRSWTETPIIVITTTRANRAILRICIAFLMAFFFRLSLCFSSLGVIN